MERPLLQSVPEHGTRRDGREPARRLSGAEGRVESARQREANAARAVVCRAPTPAGRSSMSGRSPKVYAHAPRVGRCSIEGVPKSSKPWVS